VGERRVRFGLLVYGPRQSLHVEAYGALVSILAHRPAASEIVVLTDRPDRYEWFEDLVSIQTLSADTLTSWQGTGRDRYRPKIEALRWLAVSGDAHVVLVDTDTLARRSLDTLVDRLEAGAFLLHTREYLLSAPLHKNDRSLARDVLGRAWNGVTPRPDTAMWNGGVIGCSRTHLAVLDRLPGAFDELRAACRHFAVEQLTYSVVFGAAGTVEEASPWFDHYWANRAFFRAALERDLLATFMPAGSPADAAARVRTHPIVGPLDGRPPKWRTTISRLLARTGIVGGEHRE
jgi:hypothetical protein